MYYVCTILVYLQPLIPSNTHERIGIHATKNIGRHQDLDTGHVIKKSPIPYTDGNYGCQEWYNNLYFL